MSLNVLSVPLHEVFLEHKLFNGEALLTVRPAVPIEGISVILGYGLVGICLWSDIAKLDVLCGVNTELCSQVSSEMDENSRDFPDVFVACTVTRMAQAQTEKQEKCVKKVHLPLSDFPMSQSCSELAAEQRTDTALKSLFDQVHSSSEISDCVHGYFLQDLLVK